MINKTMSIVLLTAAVSLATASFGRAQVTAPRVYVDVNVGGQVQSRDVGSSSTFPLYDETASVAITQKVGAGFLAELSGGVHLKYNVAVSVGMSVFNRSTDASVSVQIPSPVFYDRPSTVVTSLSGLRHTEIGTHIKLVYFMPINEKMDLALSGGPSFIKVSHAAPNVSIVPNTQSAVVTSPEEGATAVGVNVGADLIYLLTSRYGIGGFIRYAGGSVDLPSISGMKLGGIQAGGGLRLRF